MGINQLLTLPTLIFMANNLNETSFKISVRPFDIFNINFIFIFIVLFSIFLLLLHIGNYNIPLKKSQKIKFIYEKPSTADYNNININIPQ